MNKLSTIFLTGILLIVSYVADCQTRIAVSKTSASYEAWLRHGDASVVPVNMFYLGIDSALMLLPSCSGLLLTGGEDVYPGNYGKLNEISCCEEIDRYRDSLEFTLIKKAESLGMPIFGICRGEQILNVALGGTLSTDIPTDFGTEVIHRCPPGSEECLHNVSIDANSLLYRITGQKGGIVNSYHHQAVVKTGPGVKATAMADNGVIEAIEKAETGKSPLIIGVQWHPERLKQNQNLSYPLAKYFLEQAGKYHK